MTHLSLHPCIDVQGVPRSLGQGNAFGAERKKAPEVRTSGAFPYEAWQ